MGKYNKYDGMLYNEAVPTLLCVIANELAEKNRLKLLELKFKYCTYSEKGKNNMIKELEDKA